MEEIQALKKKRGGGSERRDKRNEKGKTRVEMATQMKRQKRRCLEYGHKANDGRKQFTANQWIAKELGQNFP